MKSFLIFATFILSTFASQAQAIKKQCQGITKAGKQCSRMVITDFCFQHGGTTAAGQEPAKTRCQGTTKAGQPCKAYPSKGSNYCYHHAK